MDIRDEKHRRLMSNYIKDIEELNTISEEFHIELEKPYNYYGSRGFMDIIYTSDVSTSICEVKPDLSNLGEAIRQLRKAEDAIKNDAIKDFPIRYSKLFLRIISILNENNIKIIKESYSILKNVDISLELLCETTNEYYHLNTWYFKDENILKYGDPLDWRWDLCKKKISQKDAEMVYTVERK